ncbi:hypothetical protein DACRYDRAFT_22906 [Dacryopinax primogenitus]|uniref:Uncharacterized protein n=1 Tax=Dacryopinax primogenitus (strain DJM 731) TaxID=1858805 RepID=M5G5Q8_DACPD|nr:uncharacterized protein DACRYDRAFT_22906 [Dacryopinax primogenitus]EJU01132.1 hypothetical protein DACRYDRAFT_22906 [Dacryopinax primogenitus]
MDSEGAQNKSWLPDMQEFVFSMDMPTDRTLRKAARLPWERVGRHESERRETAISDRHGGKGGDSTGGNHHR